MCVEQLMVCEGSFVVSIFIKLGRHKQSSLFLPNLNEEETRSIT
jgi:hypothetical protein